MILTRNVPPITHNSSDVEGWGLAHKTMYKACIGMVELTLLLGRGVKLHLEGAGLMHYLGVFCCCLKWWVGRG